MDTALPPLPAAPPVPLPAQTIAAVPPAAPQSVCQPIHNRPALVTAWPRSAQVCTAFLLGVALMALASHALGYFRWGSRPTDLERGAIPAYRIDLNRADRAELLQLPGVGENLAARIEDRRATKGPYRKVDDLRTVKRVGPATLNRLRDWVEVDGDEGEADGAVMSPARPPQESKKTSPASETKPIARKKTPPSVPIDINRAGAEELQKLPDIGPALAQGIIDARAKKPFEKVEDLTRVPGIKEKRLEALRPYVTVGKLATDEHK